MQSALELIKLRQLNCASGALVEGVGLAYFPESQSDVWSWTNSKIALCDKEFIARNREVYARVR